MSRTPRPDAYSAIQTQIGRRVRQVREFGGDSKAQAARTFGIDPSTFAKIEDRTRAPSIFFVIEMANRYRVTTDYLLRGLPIAQIDPEMAYKIQDAGETALVRESLLKAHELAQGHGPILRQIPAAQDTGSVN